MTTLTVHKPNTYSWLFQKENLSFFLFLFSLSRCRLPSLFVPAGDGLWLVAVFSFFYLLWPTLWKTGCLPAEVEVTTNAK